MRVINIFKLCLFISLIGLVWSCGDDDTTNSTPGGDELVAGFTTAANELTVAFTNNSSNDVSASWDFGDGIGTSTEDSPSYTYGAAGTYTVSLTARNADGDEDVFSVDVEVSSAGEALRLLVGDSGTKTWKLIREGTAMLVARDPELSEVFWPGSSNNGERPCLYDDSFTFSENGTFAFDDGGTFWAEFGIFFGIDGCDQNTMPEECFEAIASNMVNECGEDVSAWLSNSSHSYTFDSDANTITLSGQGAWMGIPKLGTTGESSTPVNEVTFDVSLREGGSVDTMFISFFYPDIQNFWPITYVSYDNPADEPDLVEGFDPPECTPLAPITPTEITHTFESASSTNLLEEITESAADIEYGVADPADANAPLVSRYIRTGERFQELQFRINSGNAVDFSNLTTISLDVYLPSSNIYGVDALTQNVFVGFGAITCPPLWWMDLHQYQATDLVLDEWITLTYDLATPSDVEIPANGATVFERNDKDMFFIQIGGGDHFQAGDFYVRNLVIN